MVTAERRAEQRRALDPQALMQEAKAVAGLENFGDSGFVGSMTRLLERAAGEEDITDKGLRIYRADIVRHLVNRLRAENDICKHPEILEEDVSDPIVIIGLPRSGTTKMQRMLSAAPDVQKLFLWRMRNPAPFPGTIAGQPDPRMELSRPEDSVAEGDEKHRHVLAVARAAHETTLAQVEEEIVLFDYVLDESIVGWGSGLPLFSYADWAAPHDPDRDVDHRAYRYVKTLLQYLQWQDGGKRNRPWIMKAVFHIAHIDALLESFPRATLIHCHRDPRSTTPSFAKNMWAVWSRRVNVDQKFVGREFLKWGAAAMNRYLEARKRLRLDDRVIDVDYEDIRTNIMPTIREAYRRAGRVLSPQAEQAMLRWEQENEQGKLGKYEYSLDEFGLTEEMVDTAFANYIDRFIKR